MITYRALGRYGRLGNALFEFASTIGIAKSRGDQVIFPEDWVYRPYFSIPDHLFGTIPDSAVEATEYARYLDPRCRPYLQDLRLFKDNLDEIRDYLEPSRLALEVMSAYQLPPRPRLCVHVRRGDKVQGADAGVPNNTDYHLCAELDYYNRGIQSFHHSIERVVISDDIPWCRAHIVANFYGDGRPYYKEHEPQYGVEQPWDWIDLFLMSMCDYFVVTGSTLGVWGVLLANPVTNHVVRPDKVYGPLNAFVDESLLFDPNWRVIPLAA